MFQSHIERFSPCRGGPQVCCARPDRERQRPGLRLTPGVAYRWNPDLSMRRRFKRMMGRARGRRIGVRHFLPRMKWNQFGLVTSLSGRHHWETLSSRLFHILFFIPYIQTVPLFSSGFSPHYLQSRGKSTVVQPGQVAQRNQANCWTARAGWWCGGGWWQRRRRRLGRAASFARRGASSGVATSRT